MKTFLRRYFALFLVLVTVTGVCALFAYRKSGFFVDEVYTYGLSNSYFKPFVTDLAEGGLVDKTLDRATLLDYLTVGEGERFAFASVYYNQSQDVHPPLYYWLFNLVSSLFPGFSKWPALGLDFVLYMAALLVLWKLGLELFENHLIAAAAVGLYGLSGIGVSTMLMVRMYVLLTLLTLCLALTVARLMKRPEKRLYPLVGLIIFGGLMTQYYFVFYAFFLCAAYGIRALVRRDYRDLLRFSLWALLGVGMLVAVFPACLRQLFADALVSGGNALDNLMTTASYGQRFSVYWKTIKFSVRGMLYALYALAAVSAVLVPVFLRHREEKKFNWNALLIIAPAAVTYALVVVISPVLEPRYIYNVVPVLALLPCFLLHIWDRVTADSRKKSLALFIVAMVLTAFALWEVRTYPPDYLYPEHREYNAAVAPYVDVACIYFNDDRKGAMTQDLVQLAAFEDVFVTNDPASPALKEYLAARHSPRAVVYIDTNRFWSSGFQPEEILPVLEAETGYGHAELLYKYELSETYLLTR